MASPIDWFNKNSLSKLWAKIDSLFARKTDIQTMIKAGTATNTVDETKSAGSSYFRFMPYTDTENVAYKYIRLNMTGATTSYAGLMSASDKAKLEGIETGANKLPDGGTAGQFLKKTSSGVAWADQSTVTIDSALSGTSTNPVQNKVVKAGLDSKLTTPSGGSNGQYLQKTSSGTAWATVDIPDTSNLATKDELNSLNLGGYENAKERAGAQNVNVMLTPGSYYFTDYASVTNKPSEINDNFAVDVINIANGDLVQVAYSYDSSDNKVKIFARYRDISDFVWRSWNEIGGGSNAGSESGTDFESYTLDTIEGVSAVAYRMNDIVTISIHTASTLTQPVVEQLESSFVLPESFRKKTEFETFYCGVGDFFEVSTYDYMNIVQVPCGLGLRILSDGKIAFRTMPNQAKYSGINISIDFTYNRSI